MKLITGLLVENSILYRFCQDKGDTEWFTNYCDKLVCYDKQKKKLRFVSLKEFWKTGLVMKKYIEFPCSTAEQLKFCFAEINNYLKSGSYIIQFLDKNLVCEDIVYIIDIMEEEYEIQFASQELSGEMKEETVSFEEYGKRFSLITGKKLILKFGVYSFVTEFKISINQIAGRKIGFIEELLCLIKGKNSVTESSQVLCEWYKLLNEVNESRRV